MSLLKKVLMVDKKKQPKVDDYLIDEESEELEKLNEKYEKDMEKVTAEEKKEAHEKIVEGMQGDIDEPLVEAPEKKALVINPILDRSIMNERRLRVERFKNVLEGILGAKCDDRESDRALVEHNGNERDIRRSCQNASLMSLYLTIKKTQNQVVRDILWDTFEERLTSLVSYFFDYVAENEELDLIREANEINLTTRVAELESRLTEALKPKDTNSKDMNFLLKLEDEEARSAAYKAMVKYVLENKVITNEYDMNELPTLLKRHYLVDIWPEETWRSIYVSNFDRMNLSDMWEVRGTKDGVITRKARVKSGRSRPTPEPWTEDEETPVKKAENTDNLAVDYVPAELGSVTFCPVTTDTGGASEP